MSNQKLAEINERMNRVMTNVIREMSDYDEQYERIMKKRNERKVQLGRGRVNDETEFDELYEIVKKNEFILNYENEFSELLNELVNECPQIFSRLKREREELGMKSNKLIESMKMTNKKKNMDENKDKYLMEKEELKRMVVETEDVRKKRMERRRMKEEKERQEAEEKRIEKIKR